MIITIDGPAGSGKSTISREVAKRLGMRYLDTGAMYRAITLLALEAGLVPDRITESGELAAKTVLRLEGRPDDLSRVFVDGREVTDEIRGSLVSKNVSAVSAEPSVREVLTTRQREEAAKGNMVLEGRDMGTVVCPHADLKIYLTASIEERAQRRQAQLRERGVSLPVEQLAQDIATRDSYDSGRELAPLRKAPGAVEVDTSGLTIEEVIQRVTDLAHPERGLGGFVRGPLDTPPYRFAYSFLPALFKLAFRMEISGVEHLPTRGGVVLASNHLSNLDPFFLGCACPRQIHFMAKAELWRSKLLGRVVSAFGAFPIHRGEPDRQAVKSALEIVKGGAVLGIFPEGHRQQGGRLGEIHPGVTLFSLRDDVVTIPVVLSDTDRVVRTGLLRFPRVHVLFGAPLEIPGTDVPRSERAQITADRLATAYSDLMGETKRAQPQTKAKNGRA
ncbi:MAG TPA: (d)CMP kinase [Thermoleophilia bacterium]